MGKEIVWVGIGKKNREAEAEAERDISEKPPSISILMFRSLKRCIGPVKMYENQRIGI